MIKSSRTEFIDAHGEGQHHWGFFIDDVDQEAAKLIERGVKVAFKGPGGNTHMDSDGLGGLRFELMRRRGRITDR